MNQFTDQEAEITTILVVKDPERSKEWYVNTLGAELYRSYGTSVVLKLLGHWILLVEPGGETQDKPGVTMQPTDTPNRVHHAFTIRVNDAAAVYDRLLDRGVDFLTPPKQNGSETRAFFRDPDNNLFEISSIAHD